MRLWAAAVLDNDDRFPGDNRNAQIVANLQPVVAFVHQLARRSIESYLPHSVLRRFDNSQAFKGKVDALFRMQEDQQRHFHMKNGFRLGDNPNPSKMEYFAAGQVEQDEKTLFFSVDDNDWEKLASGFGRRLSTIYVESEFRPNADDKSAIRPGDADEILTLIDAIYERI
jgi:hypothetical protein